MKKLVLMLGISAAVVIVAAMHASPAAAQCGYGYYGGYYSPGYYGYSSWFEKPSRGWGNRAELYMDERPAMRRAAAASTGSGYASTGSSYVRYPGNVDNWAVYGRSGELGRVSGTVMQGDRPRYVLFRGGFDGAQDRVYPVPWDRFSRAENNRLYMDMDSQAFANAPYYTGERPDFNTGNWDNRIRTFYSADNRGTQREFVGDSNRGQTGTQAQSNVNANSANQSFQGQANTNMRSGSQSSTNYSDRDRTANQNNQMDRNRQSDNQQYRSQSNQQAGGAADNKASQNQNVQQSDRSAAQGTDMNRSGSSSQASGQSGTDNNAASSGDSSRYSGTSIDSNNNK